MLLLPLCSTLCALTVVPTHPLGRAPARAAIMMREPDSRSRSREKLVPDLLQALNDVSLFIARVDASRMRKPTAPTADNIEAYCSVQQRKIDLLLAEVKLMRETGEGGKVKWSDIDGNLYNDAVWLNPPFDDGPSNP